jgi:hypothetical protein
MAVIRFALDLLEALGFAFLIEQQRVVAREGVLPLLPLLCAELPSAQLLIHLHPAACMHVEFKRKCMKRATAACVQINTLPGSPNGRGAQKRRGKKGALPKTDNRLHTDIKEMRMRRWLCCCFRPQLMRNVGMGAGGFELATHATSTVVPVHPEVNHPKKKYGAETSDWRLE